MSMDVKKENSFPTFPKIPLILFLLVLFFHILVGIGLNIDNAGIHSPALFTVDSAPNNGNTAVSRSSEVSYSEEKE